MMGLTLNTWLFGSAVLILILFAWLFLFWPVLRRRVYELGQSRRQVNIDLYHSQMAELEEALRLGEIGPEDAERQKAAFSHQLLVATEAEPITLPAAREGGGWLFVALGVFIPLFAGFIYLQGDGWRLVNADKKSPPWDFILHRAQTHLEQDPKDVETWVFLARSYRALERYPESAQAFAEVNRLNAASDPDILVEEGEMMALAAGGNLQGAATEKFNQALVINPRHGRALWYAGLSAVQREDNAQAIEIWQRLARQELPESFRMVLERQLTRLGGTVPEPALGRSKPVIRVSVEIAPKLQTGLAPETPVFVYARALDGSPRPLAARRLTLAELPAEVVLDDSMSMTGDSKLSGQSGWTLTARVALGGTATSQAGDPVGVIELSKADALKGRKIRITQRWKP